MSEIDNYDPNPYDDVTIDEALAQIYDRVNDRTIRQIVTILKKVIDGISTGDISRYTVEKTTAESGEVTYKLMQQINNGTPTPVGDTVGLRGSQILANYDEELQILDNIISIIKVALDGKADTTDIPTVPITAIQKNGTGITPVDGTVNITVPVVAADVAALPDNTIYAAALSLTIDSATFVVTGQLKDQNGDNLGTAQTIDLPLESVVVGGSYNSQTQKVVLTLQNGNTIEFSVADLVYGLQTELSETNKLNPAYINYDNTHRAVSDAEKSEWNGKQDAIDSSHKLSADLVDDTGATNKFATEEELEQIETNKNNILSILDGTTIDSFGDVESALADKVDKETGKGLSTNDYTTAEKTKLSGIAEDAEVNEIVGIKVNNTTVNPDANKVVNITVPTTAVDVSALPNTTKYAAALSLTINSSTFVMTGQLKDQNGDNLGTAQTIDLPLESVVVGGSYNSQTKKVVLTLQNGNTIEFSVADLVSGLQTELSASNKLNPAYIDYDSTHRAVSDTEKSTWNGKQNAIDSSHKLSADLVDDTNATNKFATEEELEQIETNKNNILSILDGTTIDSFGDVETALGDKADTSTTYTKTEVDTALSAKADKSTTYTKTEVDTVLDDKVDKVSGKGLSTNDYTAAEKTKLAGIAEGAEVNVQSNWTQTTTTADDYIKNKPTLGTAAATDATAYATAAQGTKADSAIQTVSVNGTALTPTSAKAVNITVPTQASDINALPNTTKYAAALSLTINSSTFVMTGQLKDQNGNNLGTAQTIDLPLESVVVGGSYDSQTKKVVLTLQNGNTIEFSVADLVSGLQTELSASNKLNPAYINYDSTHRAVSDTEKSTWNGKQNALSFDGTYSASTNKAATVSTVTNAVNALDVTGDASVSASKTISAWSETDGKVSISTQDIAIAGTQTTLTGYAKSGTAGQAVAATDNVNQAIGKLEATVDDNKNNISWNTNNGVKNAAPVSFIEKIASEESFTVKTNCRLPAGDYIISFDYTSTSSAMSAFFNSTGTLTKQLPPFKGSGHKSLSFTVTSQDDIAGYYFYTITAAKFENIMIRPAFIEDDTFEPYAMSNAELTAKEQQNENNISSVQEQANWNTNNGVKNICPYNSGSTSTGEGTVWNNLPIDIAAGTYSLSFSTDSTNSALVLLAADGTTEVLRKTYSATNVSDTFTISTAAKYIRLYIGATKTVSNFMIHSFGDDTFVPYALSNAELTAAEKQNENNISITNIPYRDMIIQARGTIESNTKIWKQGNHIFGQIVINTGGHVYIGEPIVTLAPDFRPAYEQIWPCVCTDAGGTQPIAGYYNITDSSSPTPGGILVHSAVSNYAKVSIPIDFVIS